MKYTSYFLALLLCVLLGFSGSYGQGQFFREIENLKEYFVSMIF